ncbi:TetR family transcriptional regulator [Sphingopyxis sp.]|uniref:TetR family transcriptional regulator n=1 Tax=Sphingopyxis sp. TaxID=1908224 RepID=UPI003BA880E4
MSETVIQQPDTPARILHAARSLMIEKGVLEVSLAEISQRAGTNVALVSYYFGNREGLMIAVAEADAKRAVGDLGRLLAADISPTSKIEAHIKGLIEAYFEFPYLHRLLQKLIREGSPSASEKVGLELVKPVAEARRKIIAEGVARGEFRDVDASLVNFLIDGASAHIFSSVEARRVVLGEGDLHRPLIDRYVRTVTDFVIAGLSPR